MKIVNPDGTPTRSGQLLLQQLQPQSAIQGTHANRPDPASVPDGALYAESDRSVLYYADGGKWHYVAGNMWGTISPDQRPTDLGPDDAGFDYRSTDKPAREFLFNGGQWIEITPSLYGTHSGRPLVTQVADDFLYVEWDRGGVIYQAEAGVWQYLAGTMWGTISPDQRPTDLGAHDVGFDFRGTDQQREFIWSGGMWVEITPVTGALNLTHPNVVTKVGGTAGQIVEGGITDQSAGNSGSMIITGAGNVGIGGTPATRLGVASAGSIDGITITSVNRASIWLTVTNGANYNWLIQNGVSSVGDLQFLVSSAPGATPAVPVMSLLSSGHVGIGTTNPLYSLQLGADSAAKPGTNTWTVASDGRLKRNVEAFTQGLETLLGLRPVQYEYNGENGTPEGMRGVGLIAQEAQAVYSGFVRTAPGNIAGLDMDVLFTNTGDLAWMMVNAFQEISDRIGKLEKAVAQLAGLP
jgi:hypothetical protein